VCGRWRYAKNFQTFFNYCGNGASYQLSLTEWPTAKMNVEISTEDRQQRLPPSYPTQVGGGGLHVSFVLSTPGPIRALEISGRPTPQVHF
jgi:hypothetical protein